jgi:hypothetical protein
MAAPSFCDSCAIYWCWLRHLYGIAALSGGHNGRKPRKVASATETGVSLLPFMAEWHGFLRGMDFDIWLCVKMKASLSNSCEATTTPQAETLRQQQKRA